ncbi:MAG: VOC family protein [Ktedonobacterales bacterium]|nr:VOC family protein [Ktedonobacterales bacterium]
MVADVQRTVEFYHDTLGFEVVATVPETGETLDWAMMGRDEVALMFQSRASLGGEIPTLAARPLGGALTLYIEVDDVRALYESLREHVALVVEPHDTFYGTREFCVEDSNGYLLVFAGQVA